MSAQPAYSAYPQRAPQRAPRTPMRVVPGRGRRAKAPSLDPRSIQIAKVFLVALIVFAVVGVVRISLSAAAVATSIESQEISSNIDEAESTASSLVVQQSLLASSARLKQEAEALGMSAPATTGTLEVPADVVVADSDGTLSLSQSVAAAAGAGV